MEKFKTFLKGKHTPDQMTYLLHVWGPSQENGNHTIHFKQRKFITGNWLHRYWKIEKVKTLKQLISNNCRRMLPLPWLKLQKVGLLEPKTLKGPEAAAQTSEVTLLPPRCSWYFWGSMMKLVLGMPKKAGQLQPGANYHSISNADRKKTRRTFSPPSSSEAEPNKSGSKTV